MLILVSLSSLVWLVLIAGRGGFWRCRERDESWPSDLPAHRAWPDLVAIMPARNEAAVIERSLGALLAQDYPGRFRVILVDDESSDGTGARARNLAAALGAEARLAVLTNGALPPGWTGKLFALASGLAAVNADAEPADFVLFCDADIALAPDTARGLVARAIRGNRVLVSLMARLSVQSEAERSLIPAFIYFFMKLYPFAFVADPGNPVAAAAGGCVLLERATLMRAGGLERIRGEIIDDCALGRLMKREGPTLLALTRRAQSLRHYSGTGPIRRMVTRSAYAELRHSPLRLVAAVLGLALTYLVPPLAVILGSGPAQLLGLGASLAMMGSFVPILVFYGLSPLRALALPVVAMVYGAFTIESALLDWRGRGGEWKGRFQAARRSS